MNSILAGNAVRMILSEKRTLFTGITAAIALLAAALYVGQTGDRNSAQASNPDYSLDAWTSIDKIEPAQDVTRFKQSLAAIERGRYEDALPVVRQLATDGVVEAQVTLGNLYAEGHGVLKDRAEATKWHQKAAGYYKQKADFGDIQAQYQLGLLYLNGVGFKRSEALSWIVKAARQGHREAQYALANIHAKSSVPPSSEHIKWLEESARNGYAPAQYKLGVYFTEGSGVEKDVARAKYWLMRAAKQGYQHEEPLGQ